MFLHLPLLDYTSLTMLDINLFLEERGGEPELIRESQRRRHESVEIVDEIIALYEDWKTSRCQQTQCNQQELCAALLNLPALQTKRPQVFCLHLRVSWGFNEDVFFASHGRPSDQLSMDSFVY